MRKSTFFHSSRKKKYLTNGPFARQLRRVRCYHKLRTPRDEWSHRESLSFSTPLPFSQALLLARSYIHSRQSMSARCGRLRRQSLFIDRCVHSRSVQKWPLRDREAHILWARARSRYISFFFSFFAAKIASHSFPVPRSESGSRLFERDILKRSGLLISRRSDTIATISRIIACCEYAAGNVSRLYDKLHSTTSTKIGKSRGQQAAVNYTLNDRKSELNVLEQDNCFSHGSLAHAS